jgi:hypothetical protein
VVNPYFVANAGANPLLQVGNIETAPKEERLLGRRAAYISLIKAIHALRLLIGVSVSFLPSMANVLLTSKYRASSSAK